ncbi:MAG: caspase family protein [Blastocatellia bacterium]|nr:caspase family protein [Blastocatellia bacterium]
MRLSRSEIKRNALLERRAALERRYAAANAQLAATLNRADHDPLRKQLELIEADLAEVDCELGSLDGETPPSRGAADDASETPPKLFGTGHRWAVLVGVDQYDDRNLGALKHAVSDVTAIRDRLTQCGYDEKKVQLLTDRTKTKPTRNQILAALQAAANATEEDDLLLFYYAGHGLAAAGESYLVGRDGFEIAVADTAVRLSRVEEIMREAKARAKVIILDACHSGANLGARGPRKMSEEFIRNVFEQAEGMAVLSSCKQGELSYEDYDRAGGIFTHFLLEALGGWADLDGKGFVTVHDANRHVVDGVRTWAFGEKVSQTPTLKSAVAGDIILADHRQRASR